MNTENENKAPPEESNILQPQSIQKQDVHQAVALPNGHVYIVALNPDGTEKENSGFLYPARNHQRIYGDKTKYSIKKHILITNNHHHYETLNRTSQQITFAANRRCNSCGG